MQSSETEFVPWSEVLRFDLAGRLILVSLGVWLHAADGLVVATMMPEIVARIGGEVYVAWAVALYELGSILAAASAALLARHFGLRRPMSAAAMVFAGGCLISALAASMEILLFGRLLQGLGGGALVSLSFVSVVRLFPTRLTARVMAIVSLLWGASAFMGPLIGGLFVEYASWRWGFGFFAGQAVLLAVWIFATAGFAERKEASESAARPPLARLFVLALAVLCVAYAGIRPDVLRTGMLMLAGLACLLWFARMDSHQSGDQRLMPPHPFDLRKPVGAALVMMFSMNAATMGLATYGALLLVSIHGTTLLMAGYVLAGVAVGWTTAALLSSGAPERLDARNIALGMSMAFVSVVALYFAVPHGPVAAIAACAVLEGVGFGLAMTFTVRRARRMVSADEIERLTGAMSTLGRFGYAVGASFTGIVANAAGFAADNSVIEAQHVARMIFTANIGFAALGLVAAFSFVRPRTRMQPV
ncbi:MFS transporter [Rhodobacteraceae bacterium D3-12]|nr:MFS transporter [Rhodobacteraceae bacterium D3-12]